MLSIKVILLLFAFTFSLTYGQKKLVCYHTNWSQYRPDLGKFFPEQIDPFLCTHIIYSFAKVSGNSLAPYEWNDLSEPWMRGMYERTIDLKKQNPQLKILLAVGGWTHGSGPFSVMVNNPTSRATFVQQATQYLVQNKFDGIDLDWEYPASRENSRPSDKQAFTELVKELSAALKPKNMLLTAAVAAGKSTIDAAYEIDIISQYFDFINLMAYDLHGTWEQFTGHHAALYARGDESGDQALLNVDWATQYWLNKGCPREKLILGMGSYGRAFKLVNIANTGLGASANGNPTAGTYTREGGFLSYYEVCQRLKQGWTRVFNAEQQVPYAYNSNEWVGYDDMESLKVKVDYAKVNQLGGAMFWALDLDDFDGKFCGQGKYPLINFVKNELANGVIGSTISTVSTSTVSTTTTTGGVTSATTGSTRPTTVSGQCYKGDGYYPDKASNCQQYYICNFTGTQYATVSYISCPNGLLFDANISACNFAQQVTC